jgi:hypothetical protein
MEVEKLQSVISCISSVKQTDLGISRWNCLPTEFQLFPVVYGFIAAIKAAPVGFPLLPSCQVRNEEQDELQVL